MLVDINWTFIMKLFILVSILVGHLCLCKESSQQQEDKPFGTKLKSQKSITRFVRPSEVEANKEITIRLPQSYEMGHNVRASGSFQRLSKRSGLPLDDESSNLRSRTALRKTRLSQTTEDDPEKTSSNFKDFRRRNTNNKSHFNLEQEKTSDSDSPSEQPSGSSSTGESSVNFARQPSDSSNEVSESTRRMSTRFNQRLSNLRRKFYGNKIRKDPENNVEAEKSEDMNEQDSSDSAVTSFSNIRFHGSTRTQPSEEKSTAPLEPSPKDMSPFNRMPHINTDDSFGEKNNEEEPQRVHFEDDTENFEKSHSKVIQLQPSLVIKHDKESRGFEQHKFHNDPENIDFSFNIPSLRTHLNSRNNVRQTISEEKLIFPPDLKRSDSHSQSHGSESTQGFSNPKEYSKLHPQQYSISETVENVDHPFREPPRIYQLEVPTPFRDTIRTSLGTSKNWNPNNRHGMNDNRRPSLDYGQGERFTNPKMTIVQGELNTKVFEPAHENRINPSPEKTSFGETRLHKFEDDSETNSKTTGWSTNVGHIVDFDKSVREPEFTRVNLDSHSVPVFGPASVIEEMDYKPGARHPISDSTTTERTPPKPTRVPGSSHLITRNNFPYNFWKPNIPNQRKNSQTQRENIERNPDDEVKINKVPEHLFTAGAGPVSVPEELVKNTYDMVTAAPSFDLRSNPFEDEQSFFHDLPDVLTTVTMIEKEQNEIVPPPPPTQRARIAAPNSRVQRPGHGFLNEIRSMFDGRPRQRPPFRPSHPQNQFGRQGNRRRPEGRNPPLLKNNPNPNIQRHHRIPPANSHSQDTVGRHQPGRHNNGRTQGSNKFTRAPLMKSGPNRVKIEADAYEATENSENRPEVYKMQLISKDPYHIPDMSNPQRGPPLPPNNFNRPHNRNALSMPRHRMGTGRNRRIIKPLLRRPPHQPFGKHPPPKHPDHSQDTFLFQTKVIEPINPHERHGIAPQHHGHEHSTRSHFDVKQAPSATHEYYASNDLRLKAHGLTYGADPSDEHYSQLDRQFTEYPISSDSQVKQTFLPYENQNNFYHQSISNPPHPHSTPQRRRPLIERDDENDQSSFWSALSNFDFSILNPFSSSRYNDDADEIERVDPVSAVPASLMVPGGLAVLGAGLAMFYFNYVWYPTPIVRARLMDMMLAGTQSSALTDDQQRAITDVSKVGNSLYHINI